MHNNQAKLLEVLGKKSIRILVTRTDRMGDLVLTTPIFAEIKKRFPHCFLAVMVQKHNCDIVDGHSSVDEVIAYDKRGKQKQWWQNLLFSFSIRKRSFDIAFHIHPTNRVHLLSFLAGIPIRIGYQKKWPFFKVINILIVTLSAGILVYY